MFVCFVLLLFLVCVFGWVVVFIPILFLFPWQPQAQACEGALLPGFQRDRDERSDVIARPRHQTSRKAGKHVFGMIMVLIIMGLYNQ